MNWSATDAVLSDFESALDPKTISQEDKELIRKIHQMIDEHDKEICMPIEFESIL